MSPHRYVAAVALSIRLALCETELGATPPPRAVVEVSVIVATRADAGSWMDPQLPDLSRHAHEQPFLRFNNFRLLDRKAFPVQVGKPITDALVNGRNLEVTLLDVADQGAEKRFHLRAAIDEPGKQALLKLLEVTASANEPFFVGGQAFRGGTLFVEIVVRP